MPTIKPTLAQKLGEQGKEAFDRHKNDRTYGLYDGAINLSPREEYRELARVISALQNDTPERKALFQFAKVRKEGIAPRLLQILSRDILQETDRRDASQYFDLSWNKLPYASRDETPPHFGLNTRRLSEVAPVPVEWLWPQRIPIAKLTIISGDPDLGKTFTILDAGSRITVGRAFPDCPNPFSGPRDILMVSAEDDDSDTLRPRIDMLGGDPSRFHSLQFVREDGKDHILNLAEHLDHLDAWLFNHPMVVLVILDPLAAFLGKVDSHRNDQVRALLTPLAKLAAKHKVAIVGINHLCKGDGDKAMYRSIGSIAFVAAARSSWLVTRDPKEKDRRLFTKVKGNNQTEDVGGLAYRIGPHIPGVVLWEPDPIDESADETLRLPTKDTKAPALAEAKHWLNELLKNGPVLASEAWEKAKADGMCEKTIKVAKRELGVRTEKTGGTGTPWEWSMPG